MIKNMYMYFLCFCLFILYIWIDKREGLQNYHENRKVNYKNIYNNLINNTKLRRMLKVRPNKPFRAKYFSSNLNGSEETHKDFAYFNNASSIFAGYDIFSMS